MLQFHQNSISCIFACLIIHAVMVTSYQEPPAYYSWARSRDETSSSSSSSSSGSFSHRSHIGPRPHVNDVMTEWSQWSPWARCSRSCGGGVRSRARTCVTTFPRVMPGSGVRTTHDQCGGESVEYGVCGTKPCPPGQVSALSFRAAQCRHYNNRRVFGRVVNNWVPYTQGIGGINPCALVCEGEGEGIVYTFGKVTDGTHCKTDDSQDGLCVNGRCLRLSCDGRLGGIAKEDMCRVCGGHNETCTRHVGVFHTDLPAADQPAASVRTRNLAPRRYGYYEVSRIPRGATNVKVTDTSANFLALKAGSKFMLNGDWLIDWPGEVDAGGVSFTYSRAEDDSENLYSLGPTTEDLTLMVLLREHNPGVHYEYWTPNDVNAVGGGGGGGGGGRSKPSRDLPPIIVPLTNSSLTTIPDTSTTTTTTTEATTPTTTSSSATTISTTTTKATTRSTTTTTPRPYIMTSINRPDQEKHQPFANLPSRRRPVPVPRPPPRRIDNDTHDTSKKKKKKPRKKPKKVPSKGKGSKDSSRKRKGKKDKGRKGKGKGKGKKQPRIVVPPTCGPCERSGRAKEKFCTSDFVSRVEVMNSEAVGLERRYEVLVHQSYKNKVPLLHKEFLWVDNDCFCPKMRHGRSYLVMGMTQLTSGREVRLVLSRGSYVRRYNPKNLSRILRIRHDEMRFCRPWRRDLRFFRPSTPNNVVNDITSNNITAPLLNTT